MKLATLGESEILITLIALAILLLSAFVCGSLIEKIKGPRVVARVLFWRQKRDVKIFDKVA